MKPETKMKLDELTQRLKDRGVMDIKFHTERREGMTDEDVARDVIEVVEAILEGRYSPAPLFGDSVRADHRFDPQLGIYVDC